jgi:hypothetical protein
MSLEATRYKQLIESGSDLVFTDIDSFSKAKPFTEIRGRSVQTGITQLLQRFL